MQENPENIDDRSVLRWIVRAAISVVVLGIIFWLLPVENVWGAIKEVPPKLWVIILGIFFLGHSIAAIKWWLLTNQNRGIPLGIAFKAHFAGLAANLCLPGVAGGDVLRAGLIFRVSENKTRVTVGSLTDRVLDIFGLLMLSAAGASLSIGSSNATVAPLQKVAILVTVVAAVVGSAVFVIPRLPLTGSLRAIADKVSSVIEDFARQPGLLALCLVFSILVQATFIQLNIELAGAAGVQLPAAAWFFAWPLAKLAASIPISLAGLGIREASLAALLVPLGGDAPQIVAVGLLWQTVLLSAGALSGIALALGTKLKPSATQRALRATSHIETDGPKSSERCSRG